jgi:hypothetical protein
MVRLLWLRVLEAVAPMESGIPYWDSWGHGEGKDARATQDRSYRNHRATTSSYRGSRLDGFQHYSFYSCRKAVQAKRRTIVASRLTCNKLSLRFTCDSHMTQAGAQT